MTQCTKEHAVEFIKNAGGLPLVFGYLMRTGGKLKEDSMQDDEHCLSIIWNLLVSLSLTDSLTATEKICLERLSFKMLEGSLDKIRKLRDMHQRVFARVSEFELDEFTTSEEIGYLENDYNFDLLSLIDCILLFTQSSEVSKRLLEGQGQPGDSVKRLLEGELQEQMVSVAKVHVRRLDESAAQLRLVK